VFFKSRYGVSYVFDIYDNMSIYIYI
jgi:hypothetical protein